MRHLGGATRGLRVAADVGGHLRDRLRRLQQVAGLLLGAIGQVHAAAGDFRRRVAHRMDAVAHLDDEVAQSGLHVVERRGEPSHLVLAAGRQVLRQVAVGDGARAAGGRRQRHGDARRHHEGDDQPQDVRDEQHAQHRGLRGDERGFGMLDLGVRDPAFLGGEFVQVGGQAVELLAVVAPHGLETEFTGQLHGLVVALEVGVPATLDALDHRARVRSIGTGRQLLHLRFGRDDGLGDVAFRRLAVDILVGQHRLVLGDAQVVHRRLQHRRLVQARHRVGGEGARPLVHAGQVEQRDAAAQVGHQHDRHERRKHLVANAQALNPLHGGLP